MSKGAFVRGKGNHHHVKLKNAEAGVMFRQQLLDYLEGNRLRDTAYQQTITSAFKLELTINELTELAIFRVLSKPWMKTFYIQHNTDGIQMSAGSNE